MTITRHQILAPPEGATGPVGPIISQAVTHGDLVNLCGVVTPQVWRDPTNTEFGDVRRQTREVLHRIDELLADACTDKRSAPFPTNGALVGQVPTRAPFVGTGQRDEPARRLL